MYSTGSRRPTGSGANKDINVAKGRNATGKSSFGARKTTRVAAPEAGKAKGLPNTVKKYVKSGTSAKPVKKVTVSKVQGNPIHNDATSETFVNRVLGVVGRMKGKK